MARADIVVANMPAAGMRASGLDYETLRGIKQDIILASATAYGEGGPYSDRIGFDGAGQVMSGAVYRQGLPDQPIRTVVPYADFGTALTMTIGVMMALYHRDRTGEGQHVEGALLPTAMMLSNAFLIERDLLGTDKPRMGNQGTSVAPCDLYRTSDDGWVLLQIAGSADVQALVPTGRAARACSTTPGSPTTTCAGRTATCSTTSWRDGAPTRPRPRSSSCSKQRNCLPRRCIRHRTCSTTRTSRRWAISSACPFPGPSMTCRSSQTPFRLSATPGVIRRRAPLLGEHTDEILDELGYTGEDIADLKLRDVV